MDPVMIGTVLDLIVKGVSVATTLISVGANAAPAFKVITDLATGAKAGTVTDADLAATEATLDGMIADFNSPL